MPLVVVKGEHSCSSCRLVLRDDGVDFIEESGEEGRSAAVDMRRAYRRGCVRLEPQRTPRGAWLARVEKPRLSVFEFSRWKNLGTVA
jgi:hypothetical protein